jgi:hypothetical protein
MMAATTLTEGSASMAAISSGSASAAGRPDRVTTAAMRAQGSDRLQRLLRGVAQPGVVGAQQADQGADRHRAADPGQRGDQRLLHRAFGLIR